MDHLDHLDHLDHPDHIDHLDHLDNLRHIDHLDHLLQPSCSPVAAQLQTSTSHYSPSSLLTLSNPLTYLPA